MIYYSEEEDEKKLWLRTKRPNICPSALHNEGFSIKFLLHTLYIELKCSHSSHTNQCVKTDLAHSN